MKIDLTTIPAEHREEAAKLAAQLADAATANPLLMFRPHNPEQAKFLSAKTPIVAAFCGNQCLAAGMQVRMADGSVRAIEDVRPGDYVFGVDKEGATRPSLVLAVHDNGVRECSAYTFGKRGQSVSVVATADHKALVSAERRAWRVGKLGVLRKRDLTKRHTGVELPASTDPDEQAAMLVGLLLGDGCLTGNPVVFTCDDPETLAEMRAEAARFGCRALNHPSNPIQYRIARPLGAGGPNPVRALSQRMGMCCYAHEKRLPAQAGSWSNAAVARLLAGLLLSDGTVGLAAHSARGCHGVVGFTSTSRAMVEDVKELMELRFGVYGSRVIENLRPDKTNPRPEYSWQVANYASLLRLQAEIPLIGPKKQRLDSLLANWKGKCADGAELLFRSAEPAGRLHTYDLTIDHPDHLFALANGLVVSNSGKSTVGAVKALVQLIPRDLVPEHLLSAVCFPEKQATHGWALCPTEDKVFDSMLPALKKWCPPSALKGGGWARAFNGERMQLTFRNNSTLTFKTYMMDSDRLGGATLDFVWFDEPPPRAHRDEAATRLLATNGPELYTMTPLKSNTGWIRREIWRKRESPDITVCKWSMRDNPYLHPGAIDRILASYKDDIWRQAREFGDFMSEAGLVYAGLERCVVKSQPTRELIRSLEHVWGIDPGIRNAAIVAGGFDSQGVDWVYDEKLIQNGTPTQYAQQIDLLLVRHGLRRDQVLFVVDPAARQRSQATGDTVQSELARVGIYTMNGNNDREAGQQQIRDRILHGRLKIFQRCVGIRDDADEFSWDMDDAADTIGPADDSPYHRLATLRYQTMVRPFMPQADDDELERNLGMRQPNEAVDIRRWRPQVEHGPLGPMS